MGPDLVLSFCLQIINKSLNTIQHSSRQDSRHVDEEGSGEVDSGCKTMRAGHIPGRLTQANNHRESVPTKSQLPKRLSTAQLFFPSTRPWK